MIYVWRARWRPGVTREQRDEALRRRGGWRYPDGVVRVHGEYWLAGDDPAVVSIFEAETFEAILEMQDAWSDVFSVACDPACSAAELLAFSPAIRVRRDPAR